MQTVQKSGFCQQSRFAVRVDHLLGQYQHGHSFAGAMVADWIGRKTEWEIAEVQFMRDTDISTPDAREYWESKLSRVQRGDEYSRSFRIVDDLDYAVYALALRDSVPGFEKVYGNDPHRFYGDELIQNGYRYAGSAVTLSDGSIQPGIYGFIHRPQIWDESLAALKRQLESLVTHSRRQQAEPARQRKRSSIRGVSSTVLVAKIADLRREKPDITTPQIAEELDCDKSALYRRAEENTTLDKILNSTATATSQSISTVEDRGGAHSKKDRINSDHSRRDTDDDE